MLKVPQIGSPETGNEFSTDDVVGGSSALFTPGFACCRVRSSPSKYSTCIDFLGFNVTMSESDDHISSSASDEQSSSNEYSEEMEVLGQVQPYTDEPLAHTSDEDEDAEEDQDGLSPAVLRSRLE